MGLSNTAKGLLKPVRAILEEKGLGVNADLESVNTDSASRNITDQPADYLLYEISGTVYVKDNTNGEILTTETDLGIALNTALANAPNNVIDIGDVQRAVATKIDIDEDNIVIRGAGSGATKLFGTSSLSGPVMEIFDGVSGVRLSGMLINGQNDANTGIKSTNNIDVNYYDLHIRDCVSTGWDVTSSFYDFYVEDLRVEGCGDYGINAQGTDFNEGMINRLELAQNGTGGTGPQGGMALEGDPGVAGETRPRGIVFINPWMSANDSWGLYIGSGIGIEIIDPYVEANTYTGIRATAGGSGLPSENVNIRGGWFHENDSRQVSHDNAKDCSIVDAHFNTDDKTVDIGIELTSNAEKCKIEGNTFKVTGTGGFSNAEIVDSGTRSLRENIGRNDGDPSTTGQWNGNGYEGAVVVDVTNNTVYHYRGGEWV